MADETTQSSAAAAPAPGGASTLETALLNTDLSLPAIGTAVDLESMLAGGEVGEPVGTGTVKAEDAGSGREAEEVAESGKRKAESGKPDTEATEATTTDKVEGKDEDETEAEEIAKAAGKEVPTWVHARLSKNAEQKRALRDQLAEVERQLQEKLDADAEAAANPVTPLPSSTIAHLDTVEALDAEVILASRFLDALTSNPEKVSAEYREREGGPTVEDQVADAKAYALHVIGHQEGHRKLLVDRVNHLEAVRKSAPAMFKVGTEEQAFYQKALRNPDLRTDPEFHQLIADAIRGRKARLELAKASAAQSPKSKVQSPSLDVVKAPPTPVPSVAATARAAVRTDDAPDPRARVWRDAAGQKAVSLDDMMDAGALSAA
jgi:hypothetical protein